MNVSLAPGTYIVAVSGGVDSMVLLDVLAKLPNVRLIVAHFNHGIRADADLDEQLVGQAAQQLGLAYESTKGQLSQDVSEAVARQKRYDFLQAAQQKYQARAIITAHHQDDVLETMLLNVSRGTGRRGLTSLRSHDQLLRPFLHRAKGEIVDYAAQHALIWHEDSTNHSDAYKRNYLRHHIMPRLTSQQRTKLFELYERMCAVNDQLDQALAVVDKQVTTGDVIDRYAYIMLPHGVACEYMAFILRHQAVRNIDRGLVQRLVVAAKNASAGTRFDIDKNTIMEISRKKIKIGHRDTRITSA
jgi:tRNA(Ile)-lysidine synthetase-like protein